MKHNKHRTKTWVTTLHFVRYIVWWTIDGTSGVIKWFRGGGHGWRDRGLWVQLSILTFLTTNLLTFVITEIK